MSAVEIISTILTYGLLLYSVLLLLFYIGIGLYSIGETRRYLNKNSFTDYRMLASSIQTPSISILAPAYNEGATIIENVRSLLSIFYSNLEVIIINDGSKDDTMQKLIDAYQLEKVDFFVQYKIPTKDVRGIYKSRNSVYKKLIVVDKVNGGKADALNVGVNVAANDYILCIDVDCILEQDAILKMVKPFLEDPGARVIASGGVVRIANSCIVEDGRLVKVRLPHQYLPRMQTLEYIRAFLLGRMAWTRMNGLLLISGAFGAFDKDIVIKCGGYDHSTVGEDMELVVRMRRYMEENNLPYRVKYIPDPLCWTEAPSSYEILGRQRNRWTRGTIETMWMHKKMFMNPKYGILGMLSYPYWFFYEMLAPAVEFLGMILFFVLAWFGLIAWSIFLKLLLFIICFGYLYSAFAVYMEVSTYHQYKRRSDIFKLLLTALTEPFFFHPFVVWSAVEGYIDLIKKKKSWGEMTRTGFSQPQQPIPATAAVPATTPTAATTSAQLLQNAPPPVVEKKKVVQKITAHVWERTAVAVKMFASYLLITVLIFIVLRGIEVGLNILQHGKPPDLMQVIGYGIVKDLSFILSYSLWIMLPFLVIYALNRLSGRIFLIVTLSVAAIIQLMLSQYFVTTLNLLGADLWRYSWNDIKQTVGASSALNVTSFIIIGLIVLAVVATYIFLPKRVRTSAFMATLLTIIVIISSAGNLPQHANELETNEEFTNNITLNKSYHFYSASWEYFFPTFSEPDIYDGRFSSGGESQVSSFRYVDDNNYPFLHSDTTADVLSPFFKPFTTRPNIVFIIVEGLGRAFANDGAYIGNFTPFLDSLSQRSLYWPNALSNGGRTFAVLPSLLGSLPYGNAGFAELADRMPEHLSIMSILKYNDYRTSFYYGGNASFDNMSMFLRRNGVTRIVDQAQFPSSARTLPANDQGFTWGYGDKDIYALLLQQQRQLDTPYLDAVLTIATHDPFRLNEQQLYRKKFEERMKELRFDDLQKKQARLYRDQLATVMYADDALRTYMHEHAKNADHANTIFVITGDHRMPEIPMNSKLDRYHVPMIIYSPLLQRTSTFNSIVTHVDVTPSLLALLKKNTGIQLPSLNAWLGTGLDTARTFSNARAYTLMQTKADMVDQIDGTYMLSGDELFKIDPDMELSEVSDDQRKRRMKAKFNDFKLKNRKIADGAPLIPDSIYRRFLR